MSENPASLPNFDDWWDYEHPDQTEQKFRDLLPVAEASPDRSYYTQLLTQLARTQGLQRKFEHAHQTLDQANALLPETDPVATVRYLLERGRVFNSSGHPEQAKPLFLQAWEHAHAANLDFYAVDAAHMLAIVEIAPQDQLAWNLKALDYAEHATEERARQWLASLYNNIGWTYFELQEYAKALEIFEKALLFREQHGTALQIRIAKWCRAKALRVLGRVEEALAIQQALLRENEAANAPDGYNYEELAECLLALNQPEQARPYFAQAYAVLSQDSWLMEHESARLERLKTLGETKT